MSRSECRESAGLLRRLAAMLYDSLLIIALLILAGALAFALRGGRSPPANASWYSVYLALVPLIFFTGFWSTSGQTLGMRSWRVRLIALDGRRVSLPQALIRFFAALISLAPAGAGFFWQLVDKEGLSWHDRLSGTKIVMQAGERSD